MDHDRLHPVPTTDTADGLAPPFDGKRMIFAGFDVLIDGQGPVFRPL